MPMSRRTSTGCGKRFCICCSGVSFCGSSAARAGTVGSDDLASPSWTDVIAVKSTERHRRQLHPAALRVMHWVNALAMIVLIGSGWKIYNDDVLIGWLHFPEWMVIGVW